MIKNSQLNIPNQIKHWTRIFAICIHKLNRFALQKTSSLYWRCKNLIKSNFEELSIQSSISSRHGGFCWVLWSFNWLQIYLCSTFCNRQLQMQWINISVKCEFLGFWGREIYQTDFLLYIFLLFFCDIFLQFSDKFDSFEMKNPIRNTARASLFYKLPHHH